MEKFNTYGQFCNGPSASTSHWGMEIECLAKLGKLKIGEVCYGTSLLLLANLSDLTAGRYIPRSCFAKGGVAQ